MARERITYLSGPVTNNPGYKRAFARAKEALMAIGHPNVINPAELDSVMHGDATYEDYMTVCLKLLDVATEIVLLPGWEKSTGCNRELGYAMAKGIDIFIYKGEE